MVQYNFYYNPNYTIYNREIYYYCPLVIILDINQSNHMDHVLNAFAI